MGTILKRFSSMRIVRKIDQEMKRGKKEQI